MRSEAFISATHTTTTRSELTKIMIVDKPMAKTGVKGAQYEIDGYDVQLRIISLMT